MVKIFKKKSIGKNYFLAACGLNILIITFGLFIQGRLPPQIPLFYSLPQGEGQLSNSVGLIIPSLFSLSITAVNFFLAGILKDNFLKRILAITSLAVSILAAITTLKIAFLVGQF